MYIVYEINMWGSGYDDYSTLENSLFDAVKTVKNADLASTIILDMILDLKDVKVFQQLMDLVKM